MQKKLAKLTTKSKKRRGRGYGSGKGKFKGGKKPLVVNLHLLAIFGANEIVDIDSLASKGIVDKSDAEKYGIKILGDGEVSKKLTINLPISKSAAKKIEQAGGKIVK